MKVIRSMSKPKFEAYTVTVYIETADDEAALRMLVNYIQQTNYGTAAKVVANLIGEVLR